ncbi:FixH family protein [Aquirufa salirivi]|uniref:FixH family protein n=1 Tax=Aquirufa salirivi TaxID=3104729 RepID=A0ABW8RVD8_9BACT
MSNTVKKSLNWGHAIIGVFILFGAFMAYFYVNMTHETIELVGDHYYEDGQKFQKKIDQRKETALLAEKVELQFNSKSKEVKLSIPKGSHDVKVNFFRPSSAALDKSFTLKNPSDSTWSISGEFLSKGPWKVNIEWMIADKTYLNDQRILVP